VRWPILLRLSVGAAALATWVLRSRRHAASTENAELRRFQKMIEALPDDELSSVHADYEFIAAAEPNPRFGLIRDACRSELNKRAQR
jgi:hypothetical protein